jgi:hypothetical protein
MDNQTKNENKPLKKPFPLWAKIAIGILALAILNAILNPSKKDEANKVVTTSSQTSSQAVSTVTKTEAEIASEKATADQKAKDDAARAEADRVAKEQENAIEVAKLSKLIPGLAPVDVYLNFEKQGFKTDKKLGSTYSMWSSKLTNAGIDYQVDTYTSGKVDTVESVSATAMLNGTEKKQISAALSFLQFASSIPYEGADSAKAAQWVEDNLNNDKAETVIGGVKYRIVAPTNLLRSLIIDKN